MTIKSYSDSLEIVTKQILIKIYDLEELGREFFIDSFSPDFFKFMSFIEFNQWLSKNWNKSAEYLKHENFKNEMLIIIYKKKEEFLFPIYPWKQEILKEVFSNNFEKNISFQYLIEENKKLKEKIELLEIEKEKK